MIDYQRILVATDFSTPLAAGAALRRSAGPGVRSELLLFHAMEGPDFLSQLPPTSEGYFPPNYLDLQKQQ